MGLSERMALYRLTKMIRSVKFRYYSTPPADLPATVMIGPTASKSALLEQFAEKLAFPDYFDKNWDALVDLLSEPDLDRSAPNQSRSLWFTRTCPEIS